MSEGVVESSGRVDQELNPHTSWPPAAAPMEVRLLSVRQPGMGHTNKLSIDGLSCEMVRTGPGIGLSAPPSLPALPVLVAATFADGRPGGRTPEQGGLAGAGVA